MSCMDCSVVDSRFQLQSYSRKRKLEADSSVQTQLHSYTGTDSIVSLAVETNLNRASSFSLAQQEIDSLKWAIDQFQIDLSKK